MNFDQSRLPTPPFPQANALSTPTSPASDQPYTPSPTTIGAPTEQKSSQDPTLKCPLVEGVWDLPISKIRIGRYNVRSPHQKNKKVAALVKQMKTPADCLPIVVTHGDVDGEFVVVHGHCRLEAARKLGWKSVPVMTVENQDEASLLTEVTAQNDATKYSGS